MRVTRELCFLTTFLWQRETVRYIVSGAHFIACSLEEAAEFF